MVGVLKVSMSEREQKFLYVLGNDIYLVLYFELWYLGFDFIRLDENLVLLFFFVIGVEFVLLVFFFVSCSFFLNLYVL